MQHVTRLPSSGGGRRGLYSPATDLNIYYLATLRAQEAWDKKMISAPACSRTMGIDFLESLAPISYGDVPSLSPPVDRIMPNEGAVIMSPSESLIYMAEPVLSSTLCIPFGD